MCQNFNAAVTRCNGSPERPRAAVLRLPLPKRTPEWRRGYIVLSGRAERPIRRHSRVGSVGSRGTALRRPSPVLGTSAYDRYGSAAAVLDLNKNLSLTPASRLPRHLKLLLLSATTGNRREMHMGEVGQIPSSNTFATGEWPISPRGRPTPLSATG